jgi:predicted nucleic acid-binding protein
VIAFDTNLLIYAFECGPKRDRALELLNEETVLSVQVLNEYAHAVRRKYRREWRDLARDLEAIRDSVGGIVPVTDRANREALRLAHRYLLSFYDCVLLAVALENELQLLYSEDMQHGLVIDGTLRIVDPFR